MVTPPGVGAIAFGRMRIPSELGGLTFTDATSKVGSGSGLEAGSSLGDASVVWLNAALAAETRRIAARISRFSPEEETGDGPGYCTGSKHAHGGSVTAGGRVCRQV